MSRKLNFYDQEAVKSFLLDVLIENQKLRSALDAADASANNWFKDYQKERDRRLAAEAKLAEVGSEREMS